MTPKPEGIEGAASAGAIAPVRVLICENDLVMSAALHDYLGSCPGVEVVGVAPDAAQAITFAASTRPDAVVVDVRMPGGGGSKAARAIRSLLPEARIIAFSAHADKESVLGMLKAGASEYLIKGVDNDELLEAVRREGRGLVGLPSFELEDLLVDVVEELVRTEHRLARAESMLEAAGIPAPGRDG